MTYTEKILYLRKKVLQYPNESTKWLIKKILSPDKKFIKTTPSNFKIGSFYFMNYDSKSINRSSKMEQIVPFMLVDHNDLIDKKVFWIMNFNFVSLSIKEAFFTKFFTKFNNTLEKNSTKKSVVDESSLPTINYENMWNELIKLGIDFSLREIRVELIEKLYQISTDDLHLLTTQNTQMLTGVDEKKLNDIWLAKLKNDSLENRIVDKNIKSDYTKIIKELQETFKFLDEEIKKIT